MKCYYLYLLFLLLVGGIPALDAKGSDNVFNGDNPAVRYIGRTWVAHDGSVAFDWVGTYFETRFTGGHVSIKVSETGESYYNVFVDDRLHRVVKISGTDTLVNLVSGIDKSLHRLRVQKRTEGEFGRTTVHQFLLSDSGYLKEEPVKRSRHIEFIGNSLTCGYGVEGKDRNEPFLLETENCNMAFAAMVARYFNADYTLIAHSGRGVVRNYGDSVRVSEVTMKDRMLNTFDEDFTIKWNFTDYHPDLVVVNLGSNDFSTEPHPYKSEFVKGYTQLVMQLRKYYGDIPIICVYPVAIQAPVFEYYQAVIDELNDSNVFLLRLDKNLYNRTTDMGAAWHPGYSAHKKMAMWLIPYIATVMGWDLTDEPVV